MNKKNAQEEMIQLFSSVIVLDDLLLSRGCVSLPKAMSVYTTLLLLRQGSVVPHQFGYGKELGNPFKQGCAVGALPFSWEVSWVLAECERVGCYIDHERALSSGGPRG